MRDIKEVLKEMDLEHFGSGKHRMTLEQFLQLLPEDKVVGIDVRTPEENRLVKFSFLRNIPLNELPERVNEIPKDETVVFFCSGKVRSAMAYLFFKVMGYENVKILDVNIAELSDAFKPGLVRRLQK